jgi:malonyl-CoA/methylmalonyl-CoA synthetase
MGRELIMANLFQVFRDEFPANLAKAFLSEFNGGTITYRDLIETTGRMASRLSELGLRPGDRLALQVEKSAEALMLYLATLRVGAVLLPLNPAYTLNEVKYFIEDAEPTLLVCRPQDEVQMQELTDAVGMAPPVSLGLRGEGSLLANLLVQSPDFHDAVRERDDLAAILYTSGTTGRSKGAMLTHDNLRSNAETLKTIWRFTSGDRLIHALPIFHTHGLFVATNVVLTAGAELLFLPKFDVPEILHWMPRATVLMGVPTFYSRLLSSPEFGEGVAAKMRLFISGSAPLSADTHREFLSRTGQAILERYGMTETNMNTSNPYGGERVPGSVGFPLPDVELRIADAETGVVLESGVGVIEVRGPNVFKGYWRRPEKTAEDFRSDGFFVTGDLGYRDDRGYVFIVGREKDLIISGGLNIYPAEIETVLDGLPAVSESAVIGVPHADLGEAVVAVVTLRAEAPASESEIVTQLADQLARFKQPRRILFVDALPRNTMAKIQKKELRERFSNLFASSK